MGHWSQRRLRGGAGTPAPSFPFPPPATEDWQLSDEGANTFSATILNPGLAPTDGFDLQYQVNSGGWLPGGPTSTFAPNVIPGNPPGSTIEAHIRWFDLVEATPMSDWSPSQIIILT